jgi:hypothetical protein
MPSRWLRARINDGRRARSFSAVGFFFGARISTQEATRDN